MQRMDPMNGYSVFKVQVDFVLRGPEKSKPPLNGVGCPSHLTTDIFLLKVRYHRKIFLLFSELA